MRTFVLESGHSQEECNKVMIEIAKKGTLNEFVFGCKYGEHIGWSYVEANDREEVLEMVPDFIRGRALAYEVEKVKEDQIKGLK